MEPLLITQTNLEITNNATSSSTKFSITGSVGVDLLVGSNGNDTLEGGLLADTLTGGTGADTFVFGSGGNVTNSTTLASGQTDISSNIDVIDAKASHGDKFDFSDFDNVVIADGAVLDSTTVHDGTANTVVLLSGAWDGTTFTAAAYGNTAADNDTLLQVSGGGNATNVNNFLVLDSGAIASITFVDEVGTLE